MRTTQASHHSSDNEIRRNDLLKGYPGVQTHLRYLLEYQLADWPFGQLFSCGRHDVALYPLSSLRSLGQLHLLSLNVILNLCLNMKHLRCAATLSEGRRSREVAASRWTTPVGGM